MCVEENSVLLLNFALALTDGEVIDSNLEHAPLRYTMGSGDMLPGFERAMLGMRAGEKKTLQLDPAEAFGLVNEDNVQRFARDKFSADTELQAGVVLSFSDAAGAETPGVVVEVGTEYATVDFNHPLAGREISFTVHVHEVIKSK
ncbi:MAG: peptidylprolyl isomerase [Pseudomonadales bacterium]